MRRRNLHGAVALLLGFAVAAAPAHAQVRLKDIARVDGGGELQLVGYGLVVGLDGTGDSRAASFTSQTVANMLTRMGISVQDARLRVKNTAAVMVSAKLAPNQRPGTTFDVTVSSLGDARSLEGGVLLSTPLATPEGLIYATAQGPVSVGGFSVRSNNSRVSQNYVLAGRVPGGGSVETTWAPPPGADSTLTVILQDPDYTTAQRVAVAINAALPAARAQAIDAGTIVLQPSVPEGAPNSRAARVDLLARIESLLIEPDTAARVVVNERTGTIVAGEHVTLAGVAIAHGNLSVRIDQQPVISQPNEMAMGRTVVTEKTDVNAGADPGTIVPVPAAANVGDLAHALNALGVAPRDMIAILQALKEAGALRAELRIL
jgi:flagellar P-ring protein FlgI